MRHSIEIPELIRNTQGLLNPNLPYSNMKTSDLPSKGLYYDGKNIKFQTFSLNQLKKLSTLSEGFKLDEAIRITLEGIECSFNKEELLYEDLQFINFLRKVQALQIEEFTIPSGCSVCGEITQLLAKPTDIEFTDIEIDSVNDAKFTIKQFPEEEGKEYIMLPPSVYTVLQLEALKDHKDDEDPLELGIPIKDLDVKTLAIALNVAGGELVDHYKMLDNLFGTDNALGIAKASNLTDFGLLKVEGKCENVIEEKKCGGQLIMDIATIFSVILPFRGNEGLASDGSRSKVTS